MGETEYGVATIPTTTTTIPTTTTTIISKRRLKKEDCSRTKHDSAFSNWKTLIGPSDWEDHAQGKEGAEKYRVKNLPNCTFCPGVYEFGIVLSRSQSGRETRKLDPDFVIPVYLGKSNNVRNRLQQYGRDGAHLENGSSNCKLTDCNNILTGMGQGLFSEIFTKGFSIVYRWAPMTNPREAEKTEAELLEKFDYAWNKGSNGPRRQNDILKRIDCSTKTPQFLRELQLFPQRRKGIKIKACKLPLLEDAYNFYTDFPPNNFLSQVLKFGRSRPMLVSWRSGIDKYSPSICGVALGHGVVCTKPPSEGRKRCAEHKGMKINAANSKLLVESKFTLAADKHLIEKDIAPVCGVILPGGSSFTMEPVQGNKRCLEHKGRKVRDSTPQSLQAKKEYTHASILDYNNDQNMLPNKAGRLQNSSCGQVAAKDGNTTCGADLEDGTSCTRQPPRGRKRCEEHKGIRVKEPGSKSFTEQVPYLFDSSGAKSCSKVEKKNHAFLPSFFSDTSSPTCGVTLQEGGLCSRTPVEGNKRCWQHKGTRVEQNHTSSIMDDKFSRTCDAVLNNGSFCTRTPTEGNKRCWQHKGMRDANSGSSTCYKSQYYSTAPGYCSYDSLYEHTSQTCGAPLRNGSYCSRRSNGRCWQHGADSSSGSSLYNWHHQNTASCYSSYDSIYGHTSQTCGAPLRNGSYCRRRSSGPCWQHGG